MKPHLFLPIPSLASSNTFSRRAATYCQRPPILPIYPSSLITSFAIRRPTLSASLDAPTSTPNSHSSVRYRPSLWIHHQRRGLHTARGPSKCHTFIIAAHRYERLRPRHAPLRLLNPSLPRATPSIASSNHTTQETIQILDAVAEASPAEGEKGPKKPGQKPFTNEPTAITLSHANDGAINRSQNPHHSVAAGAGHCHNNIA